MTDRQKIDELFWNKTTPEVVRDLLGIYLEHDAPEERLVGYIVDAGAYLGPEDKATHSYGLRGAPRVRAAHEKLGMICLYMMHARRTLGIITRPEGIPQGIMIHAIGPVAMIDRMSKNRDGKTGPDTSSGPGKLARASATPQELYGQSIVDSSLRLVFEKKKTPERTNALPRIGIPNKGIQTEEPLRFVVSGNPYVFLQRKNQTEKNWGWRKENEKERSINIFR